jgi:chromosome segregation ATPase
MHADVLKQLDDRIEACVKKVVALRRENEELTHRLANAEQRLEHASAQLRRLEAEREKYESERSEVRSRIEKILARFDGLGLG